MNKRTLSAKKILIFFTEVYPLSNVFKLFAPIYYNSRFLLARNQEKLDIESTVDKLCIH